MTTIQITGKNIDVGDALRAHVTDRIDDTLDKYLGRSFPGHVRIEKIHGRFITNLSVHLWSGMSLQAHAEAADAYVSADAAVERLDKRLRRYKSRLRDHHSHVQANGRLPVEDAANYVIQSHDDDDDEAAEHNGNPVIVAETKTEIRQLPVSDAVMEMDLSQKAFLVFRNAKNGKINVIFRREDGNIGWIDPELTHEGAA